MKIDFNNTPAMPELPPMQPVQMATPQTGGAVAQQQRGGFQAGGRSLRQVLGLITQGGLLLLLIVVGLEMVAKDDFKPSKILGRFEASRDLTEMQEKNPGLHILNEADYRTKLTEAERNGQAKAELNFQTKLAAVQADKERVTAAYQSLYERTRDIAKVALEMEASLQQARQQTVMQGQAGTAMSANLKDMWCALSGDQTACASASADRSRMVAEVNNLSTMDSGSRLGELMRNIDDQARQVVGADMVSNGVPTIQR